MVMSTLPLKGARKKPAPKPRTEGVTRLKGRKHFYARIWTSGSKRARYISTEQSDVIRAQELMPHIRAVAERSKSRVKVRNILQPELEFPTEGAT